MNKHFITLMTLSFICLFSLSLLAEQTVYQYKNSDGVVEFTDEIKADKQPEKKIQIKKMTPEEEALSQKKLQEIRKKDAALNKRLAREIELENEQQRLYDEQKARERMEPQYEEQYSRRTSGDVWYAPGRPVRPGRPPGARPPIVRPPGTRPPVVRPPIIRPPGRPISR